MPLPVGPEETGSDSSKYLKLLVRGWYPKLLWDGPCPMSRSSYSTEADESKDATGAETYSK